MKDKKPIKQEHKSKRYDIVCPYCGKALQACKCLGMEVGWTDFGFGQCPHCKHDFKLKYDFEKDELKAHLWSFKNGKQEN